jgi:low affinity Fe/Cu permease
MHSPWPFARVARFAANLAGSPRVFALALAVIIAGAATGPLFSFSDTWQLVINTVSTIVTFLMVFLIQNTQNRDSTAVQLKLDELIRVPKGAHNALLDLEELSQEDLDRIRRQYAVLALEAKHSLDMGLPDTDTPDVQSA